MQNLENLIADKNVLALFDYGSIVYGTTRAESDHDMIMIVKNPCSVPESQYDMNVYSQDNFIELIQSNEVSALECLFLSQSHIHKNELNIDFQIDKSALRNSLSAKASNSWVKAKKKFIVEADYSPYIGQKSAWHALRILDFGCQLAQTGKINDYSSSNHLLKPILACTTWPEIDAKFRQIYNNKSSEFRLLAPKDMKKLSI